MSFDNLNLHAKVLANLNSMGFTQPTPVQEQAIPLIMEGNDVMACAQTGTGKTGAFCLPIIHHLLSTESKTKKRTPRALILTPTRELADQVLSNIKDFTAFTHLTAGLVVGGVAYGPQIQMLRRSPDIIVATPGRLIDHLKEGLVNLSNIELVVLDEADRMLDMGFLNPVEMIMQPMPKSRQTLLFSATFSKEVENLAQRFLTEPVQIKLAAAKQNHDNITQSMFYSTSKEHKIEMLEQILADREVWQSIIFVKTKSGTEKLAKKIAEWGHETAALHGDMRQSARKRVVSQMHKGTVRVLVATDVAARGLDVKELTHVINFDLPQVAEDYTHRIGRTGRAGAHGFAVSFVSGEEMALWRDVEKIMGGSVTAENPEVREQMAPSRSKKAVRGGNNRRPARPSDRNKGAPRRLKAKDGAQGYSRSSGDGESSGSKFPRRSKPRSEGADASFAPRKQRSDAGDASFNPHKKRKDAVMGRSSKPEGNQSRGPKRPSRNDGAPAKFSRKPKRNNRASA